jgi:nitrite reductase/ring-hydroxylating ferredoxin subunit
MGAVAGAVIGAGAARLTEAPSKTRVARGGEIINPKPGRWVDVAALTDLPEGQGFRVTAGAVGAFLFRRSDRVAGVSSVCSHMPCELNWEAGQAVLRCPCHPWDFTPDGRSTATASPLPNLNTVMVRVENGRILVKGT